MLNCVLEFKRSMFCLPRQIGEGIPMHSYRIIRCALGCAMSFTATFMLNPGEGCLVTGMAAQASTLSQSLPMRFNQLPDRITHLIQDNSSAFQVKDAGGPVGTAIPIQIQLPFKVASSFDANAKYTFLMFRGLPDGFKLSSGFVTKNAYVVSIAQYKNISIIPTQNYEGKFPLRVLLYKGNNIPPIERLITVSIGTNDTRAGDTTASSDTSNTAIVSQPTNEELNQVPRPTISPESEASSLAQGQQFVKSGNIVYARLIFEDLALQGSARGAFALGQTYDPDFLTEMNVVGLQPDIDAAKKWYQKAAKLGNQSAANRLDTIAREGR
jgi:hypothetical protein